MFIFQQCDVCSEWSRKLTLVHSKRHCDSCYNFRLNRIRFEEFIESLQGPVVLTYDIVKHYLDGYVISIVAYEHETGHVKLAYFGVNKTQNYAREIRRLDVLLKKEAQKQGKLITFNLSDRASENHWVSAFDVFLSTNYCSEFIIVAMNNPAANIIVYKHTSISFIASEIAKVKPLQVMSGGMSGRNSTAITNTYDHLKDKFMIQVNGYQRLASDHFFFGKLMQNFYEICTTFSKDEIATPSDINLLNETINLLTPVCRKKNWATKTVTCYLKILVVKAEKATSCFIDNILLVDVLEMVKLHPWLSTVSTPDQLVILWTCSECHQKFNSTSELSIHSKVCSQFNVLVKKTTEPLTVDFIENFKQMYIAKQTSKLLISRSDVQRIIVRNSFSIAKHTKFQFDLFFIYRKSTFWTSQI